MGYCHAGFKITGIDIHPQPHFPFEFHQADALDYLAEHGGDYDVIHASPVCKKFSRLNAIHKREYPDYISSLRSILKRLGKPYVIENVPEAPLENPLILCGTMFPGLRVIRHRAFETKPPIYFPPAMCNHWGTCSGNAAWRDSRRLTPSLRDFDFLTITGNDYIAKDGREAMGIDWMTKKELSQAIPRAYTEWIGRKIMENLDAIEKGGEYGRA